MINQEKLKELYHCFINENIISTKKLNELGLTSKNINILIDYGVIKRIKRGFYSLENIDGLFHYGKYLISKKDYDLANKCFIKCFELDNEHYGACFQLFLKSIKLKDYDNVFKYLDILLKNDNKFYKQDLNYYLYLLNNITLIPDKYKEYVNNIEFDDIKILPDDKRFNDMYLENKIRSIAFNNNFSYALYELNNMLINNNSASVQNIISKHLLKQATTKKKENYIIISKKIKEKDYAAVIKYFEGKDFLEKFEELVLYLSKLCINIKKTCIRPKLKVLKGNDILKLINNKDIFSLVKINDFKSALELSIDDSKKKNISLENNPVYLLLLDVCNLCQSLKDNKSDIKSIPNELDNEEEIILEKYEELKSNPLILLKPMEEMNLEKLELVVNKYPDIVSFRIKDKTGERLALKYNPYNEDKLPITKLYNDGMLEYKKGNYNDALNNLLLVFKHVKEPSSYLCYKIGVAYLRKKNKDKLNAIKYLKLANYLSKKNNDVLFLDDMILSLENPEIVKKPYFDINEKLFNLNDEFYGIFNFKEINDYINTFGLTINEACRNLYLTLEETYIVKLIYAKIYYTLGFYENGDLFLKSVEKSINKTPKVNKIIEDIRINKKFYKNRELKSNIKVSLKLKPNK